MLLLFSSMLCPGSSKKKIIMCSVKFYVCKEKLVIGNWWGIFYFHSKGLLKPSSLLLISIPLRTTFLQMITLYTWLLIPGFDPFTLSVLKKRDRVNYLPAWWPPSQEVHIWDLARSFFDFLGKIFHSHCTNVHPRVYN